MTTVQSKDGTAITFDRHGDGPPVILVGGALQYRGIDARTAELARLLAARFTVYHYDRRGRGASGDTPPYATEREIEDLDALIAEAGGQAYVFAMSSGGALALDAAARGSAITRLALYEPPFIVDDSRPPLPPDYVEQLSELATWGQRGDAVAYFMTTAVGVLPAYVAAMRNEPFWATFEAVAHTLAYDGRFIHAAMQGSPVPLQRWASVAAPTLVIDGGASHPHIHAGAEALAGVLPHAQGRTLPGQGHNVAPEVLAPVLLAFFAP